MPKISYFNFKDKDCMYTGFGWQVFKFRDFPWVTIDKERPCSEGFYINLLLWKTTHSFRIETKFLGNIKHDKFK